MLVDIFDGDWNSGYLLDGGRNLIVGTSNGDIRQWKEYGWYGKLYQHSEETHAYKITAVNGWHCCYYTDLIDYIGKKVTASMQAKLISAETTSTNTNSSFMLSNNFIVGGYHDISATIYKPQQDTWLTISKTFVLNETGQFGIGVQCQPENAGGQTAWLIKDLKLELGTVATDWTPAPEDTFELGTAHPNSVFTSTIPVKKNIQYVYGLPNQNKLPAHTVRYMKPDGTWIKAVHQDEDASSGVKLLAFDDDYNIEIMFQNGLSNEQKANFYFMEENNMAIKSADQITIVDVTDAYSVMLTSEAYTFVGGVGGVGSGQACTTEAVAYCGSNQCAAVNVTVGDIVCPTGISAKVENSGTSKVKITFTTTATISTSCEATIPVVVDGITVNKKFSFAVAKAGQNGTSVTVKSTSVTYQVGDSGTTKPTGTWGTDIPSVSNGKYLWTKTVVVYSDNKSTEAYSVSYKGTNGTSVTVSSSSVTYQVSTSGTTTPTGSWAPTVPTVPNGQFLWTKTVVTYSDGKFTTSYSVSYKGTNGVNGADAISMTITSSNGTVFKNNSGSTILTAHVYKGGVEQTVTEAGICGSLGSVKWYKAGSTTAVATANTYTISAADVENSVVITAQLEK